MLETNPKNLRLQDRRPPALCSAWLVHSIGLRSRGQLLSLAPLGIIKSWKRQKLGFECFEIIHSLLVLAFGNHIVLCLPQHFGRVLGKPVKTCCHSEWNMLGFAESGGPMIAAPLRQKQQHPSKGARKANKTNAVTLSDCSSFLPFPSTPNMRQIPLCLLEAVFFSYSYLFVKYGEIECGLKLMQQPVGQWYCTSLCLEPILGNQRRFSHHYH